jgi:DNA-binding NarL/FixJ family response regulator
VIIVTVYEKPDYLYEAISAGAAGYLLKDARETELLTGIRRVLRGESLLRPTHEGRFSGVGPARPDTASSRLPSA